MDESGAVVWAADYEAFGKATVTTATVTNNLRFPGQYYDAETGLHYNWNRYYDPGTGRYSQVDLIGFKAGDADLYRYVQNNPMNLVDPIGLVCGPAGKDWIIPDKPGGFDFTGCCQGHDDCYNGKCGTPPKATCDENFYDCLIKTCNRLHGGQDCYMWAAYYYKKVKESGNDPFNKARNKQEEKCKNCH